MEKKVMKKSVKIGLAAALLVLLAAGVSVYAASVNGGAGGNIGDVKDKQMALEEVKDADANAASEEKREAVDQVDPASASSSDAGAPSSEISLEKAKSIALTQVSGASSENITKAYKDYDDGRAEYDIEIKYNGYEYDFEISASSGNILSKDVDRIEYDDADDRYDDDRYDD